MTETSEDFNFPCETRRLEGGSTQLHSELKGLLGYLCFLPSSFQHVVFVLMLVTLWFHFRHHICVPGRKRGKGEGKSVSQMNRLPHFHKNFIVIYNIYTKKFTNHKCIA